MPKPDIIERFYSLANGSQLFPGRDGSAYVERYEAIYRYVSEHVYPHVSALAALEDEYRGFLTGHDQRHALTVMQRAWQLISQLEIDLTGYEFYILIIAILIHDIGNILGRNNHERSISRVINAGDLRIHIGTDRHERNHIIRIAEAHGGYLRTNDNNEEVDKDTLKGLEAVDYVDGHKIRPQLLSAILRLADELAEEPQRASRFAINNGSVPESEIYHAYALTVNSTRVNKDARAIEFIFSVDADAMLKTWTRLDRNREVQEIFLLEYIFERAHKTYIENLYCMRYMRDSTPTMTTVDAVKIEVKIYGSLEEDGDDGEIRRISDTMRESGYPSGLGSIRKLCPALTQITGESIKAEIESRRATSVCS